MMGKNELTLEDVEIFKKRKVEICVLRKIFKAFSF